MGLSSDLITQFIKSTRDNAKQSNESSVYGVVSEQNGEMYVMLDGSDVYTPVISTVKIADGDRVVVRIKDHAATVTGNITNQSAGVEEVGILEGNVGTLLEVDELITGYLGADYAKIQELVAQGITVENLIADKIDAERAEIDELFAKKAEVGELVAERIEAVFVDADYATIGELTALTGYINNLLANYATIERLTAERAEIDELYAKKADVESLSATYADIDFANITELAVENLIAMTGYIDSIVGSDGTFTDTLVGVTIKGDLIEAGTLVADKLVVLGPDGLYYRLNLDGSGIEAEQTEYNSLNGSVIAAKSITATKIAVDDLVAFGATIGGFNITENSIYSEVKDSEENTTRGIYFDTDGQMNIGDANNFIKYLQNEDGTYSLAISAESIMYALDGTQRSLSDLAVLGEYVLIDTYEGEPCIILGTQKNDFRLIITNTRILFQDGTETPAYITNQSLHIKKAVVEEEMAFGQFVWQTRSNGNMGLVWKDEIVEEIAEEVGE